MQEKDGRHLLWHTLNSDPKEDNSYPSDRIGLWHYDLNYFLRMVPGRGGGGFTCRIGWWRRLFSCLWGRRVR
uniref:Uncharacterized protein n=1 Tax=mine drainage metagenome TaxID=410659 RepID=E6QMU2_9ZZZZ